MTGAAGFPDRLRYTPVPTAYLTSVLPGVEDPAELKVTLHLFRLLQEARGHPRFVQRSALLGDRSLALALRPSDEGSVEELLDRGLRSACQRGIFLPLRVRVGETTDTCYFLNTPSNQRLVERVLRGETTLRLPAATPLPAAPVPEPRPNIFELYEQNIGLLTPLIAEELLEASRAYPAEWIEDAFREAVGYNRRHWRYIRRILETWATEGRGDGGATRRRPQAPRDPRAYLRGTRR